MEIESNGGFSRHIARELSYNVRLLLCARLGGQCTLLECKPRDASIRCFISLPS